MKGTLRILILLSLALLGASRATKCVAQLSGNNLALPFFHNIPASTFKAHNQSMDILADDEGRIYVANFEGLVIWDGVAWTTIHSPRKSRFTCLMRDKKGHIWAGGLNLLGRVEHDSNGMPEIHYLVSDTMATMHIGEAVRLFEDQHGIGMVTGTGQVYHVDERHDTVVRVKENRKAERPSDIDRWRDEEVHERLVLPDGTSLMATVTRGVVALGKQHEVLWQLDENTGLCSNSVVALCYDGRGTVWGATENGLFNLSTTKVYTQFSESNGLKGQVNTVMTSQDTLFVGTLQGLYVREGDTFHRMEGIKQSCRQLALTPAQTPLIAAADGVFTYENGKVNPLYKDHYALSLHVIDEECFLYGAIDGIYRGYFDGRPAEQMDSIPYVYRFTEGKGDSLWVTDTYRKTYWSLAGETTFTQRDNRNISPLLDYTDEKGRKWQCLPSDMGLTVNGTQQNPTLHKWLSALENTSVQNIMVDDEVAWLGGAFGLIRLDLREAAKEKPYETKVHIRTFTEKGRNVSLTMATDRTDFIGHTQYSYRMHLTDEWSEWGNDQSLDFYNMSYGQYVIQVRSRDPYGHISESERKFVHIHHPIGMRWYTIMLYVIIGLFAIYAIYRWRVEVMIKRQERLEKIVSERTRDLREAQNALLIQEREATVGKLTKGLIDRILNPMNYVGNFSHLTRGLIGDLKEDIEEERKNMSADNYDDAAEILAMMDQNLEKIEQHGLSTTRVLKAMEDILRERSKERTLTDLCVICQQDVDMLCNYYKDDIEKGHVTCDWKRPSEPIMAEVNAEQISHLLTAMLNNAAYSIKRRLVTNKTQTAEGTTAEDYQPRIALILEKQKDGRACIRIWDNGMGIEKGVIDKVFDPFFTTKPTAEASGIGLYLAQQIIQDHGGTISVSSEKYQYTEFTITL